MTQAPFHKTSFKPSQVLQPFIDRYWFFETNEVEFTLPSLIPGTGLELVFNFKKPPVVYSLDGTQQLLSLNFINCVRRSPFRIQLNADHSFIAVRFKAGAFRHFSSVPLKEFADNFVAVNDVFGASGEQLSDLLNTCSDMNQRIVLLEKFLLYQLKKHYQPDALIDNAVKSLYYADGSTRVIGLSGKTLSKLPAFRQAFHKCSWCYTQVFPAGSQISAGT